MLNWDRLRAISRNRTQPWLAVGDFNDIVSNREKVGGRPKEQRKIDGFNRLLDDLALGDVGFKGNMFTWSNNRGGTERIAERLDRALANEEWFRLFPKA